MIPAWLERTLGDTYRTVRLRICTRCHAPILTGLDADICAFTAHADLTPLTPPGEAIALLTGRHTYDLIGSRSEKRLNIREAHNIESTRRYPVLPEHRCGQPLTEYLDEAAKNTAPKKLPKIPPF